MNERYTDTPKGGDAMQKHTKRTMITLRPEWESELDTLKKEQFYNETQAEMFRHIISCGLDVLRKEKVMPQSQAAKA